MHLILGSFRIGLTNHICLYHISLSIIFFPVYIQISCFSTSAELSDRVRFPRYFQMGTTEETVANGFYALIKEFQWKKVALIVQDENLFTEVA